MNAKNKIDHIALKTKHVFLELDIPLVFEPLKCARFSMTSLQCFLIISYGNIVVSRTLKQKQMCILEIN